MVIGNLLIALLPSLVHAQPNGRYAAQLQAECRALVAAGVDKPYGLAWGIEPGTAGAAPRAVSMEPLHSPAAGAVLMLSGQFLKDDSLITAAKKSAAAVVASQTATGQIAPAAMFGDKAEPKTADAPYPDRGSTRAGLALLLLTADAQLNKDQAILDSIDKGWRWLAKQQNGNSGAWLRLDPAVDGGKEKCTRLDDSDLRDGAFTYQLIHDVLENPDCRSLAEKQIQLINNWQNRDISEFLPGGRLWSTAYNSRGEPVAINGIPKNQSDMLATRYVAQTLLGVGICTGNRLPVSELERAIERINQSKDGDSWPRYAGMAAIDPNWPRGDFGLPPVIAAAKALKSLGVDRYKQMLSKGFTPKQHLAMCIVGLNDQPFTLDWPVAGGEVAEYVRKREADWRLLDGPVPTELPARVKRIWLLLQRAKLEAAQN